MGKKRDRNKAPQLRTEVANLLALHSLTAWPFKEQTGDSTSWRWYYQVFPIGSARPVPAHLAFYAWPDSDLRYWMDQVKRYERDKRGDMLDPTVGWGEDMEPRHTWNRSGRYGK